MSKLSKQTTTTLTVMLIVTLVLGTILFLSTQKAANGNQTGSSIINGNSQTLKIKAISGGYSPNKITARAGIPGKIIFPATSVLGCQNSVVIPELNESAVLSRTSDTEFAFEAQPSGKVIKGSCTMGMYDFEINFN